jgi:ABC-type bacteriocin/lantibiotic exporter with double-glycine peptidase domain
MAPLETGGLGLDRPGRVPPIDSLLRALLYMAQQAGRPLSEADVRRLAGLPDQALGEAAFLMAGRRLGLEAAAYDLASTSLDDLTTPFAVTGKDAAQVVVACEHGRWTVLDVVEGRVTQMTADSVRALGLRALVLREPRLQSSPAPWYAPLWRQMRPVIVKLAAASLGINLLGLATPLFMMLVLNRIVGHGVDQGAMSLILVLSLGMLAAYALDFGLRVARGWLSARTGARLEMLMSAEVVHRLVQLPYRHFEGTPSGVIAERLRQLDVLRGFLTGQLPVLAIDLAFVVLFLGTVCAVSATLGLVATLAVPVLLVVSLATHRMQRRLVDESFHALAAKGSTLNETVANAATVKALGLEAEMQKRWQARVEQAAWTSFRASNLANIAASASGAVQLVASLALIVVGVGEIADHRLTVGALIAASMLATRALQPMRQLAGAWHQLQAVRAAFRRIDELMREEVEGAAGERMPMPALTGQVSLEHVSWRAGEATRPVLVGADLEIAAGEILGIVGPSGSGKTTIANLIQGLCTPTGGRILVDGTDVAHLPPAQLRAQIGSVPQDLQLFTGSVRDNIAMGVADKDPGRVVAVARFVGAHGFIQRLPQGYNTPLGERGSGLSTGQRQLLCIARALIRNPRILILDEATSALDPAAEEQLLRQLKANARGRTVIMITHRLAPLSIADRVALVMDGRIERVGPPTDIMAYARIRMAEASRVT